MRFTLRNTALIAQVILATAGCHRVFPMELRASDSGAETGGPGDARVDGGRVDLSAPGDVGALFDLRTTLELGNAPDLADPHDGPAPPDQLPPADTGAAPDGPVADVSPIVAACANTAVAVPLPPQWTSGAMQICQSTTPRNQCKAEQLCANGWHLCSAGEYQTRGGQAAGGSPEAWVGSCIRSGTAANAPSTQACASCELIFGGFAQVSWACGTGTPLNSNEVLSIGVKTAPYCNRLGTNDAGNEASWYYEPAAKLLNAAVCCQ